MPSPHLVFLWTKSAFFGKIMVAKDDFLYMKFHGVSAP